MTKRARRGKADMIVVHMDGFISDLLIGAKEDKPDPETGKGDLTIGEKLRIADAVTKWVSAKNRLEDIDDRVGIDTLKDRLRGGTEGEANSGTQYGRRSGPIDRGGPELDKLKRRLPDHGNGSHSGRRGDNGDEDAAAPGARGGVVVGVVDDDGPDDDEDSERSRV